MPRRNVVVVVALAWAEALQPAAWGGLVAGCRTVDPGSPSMARVPAVVATSSIAAARVGLAPGPPDVQAPASGAAATSPPAASGTPGSPVTPDASLATSFASFPPGWPYRPGGIGVRSPRGMVTTDNALATRVGRDVLDAGGNAVDAAVAAAFALAVVFPTAGNIGGGGFLVARVRGAAYALDFRETAPRAARRDMYLDAEGKATRDSLEGWRSAGVPGSVAGLWQAWHRLGSHRRSWSDLVAPAIALAEQGFVVDAPFARTIELAQSSLAKFPASAALFLPGGAPPSPGTTWRDPELAAVLRRVAQQGPAGFYRGPVAETIDRRAREGGGLITAADLESYGAKWRPPIAYAYRGRQVFGMPPPSSGGITMAMIAHLLSAWDLHRLGFHSAAHVHLEAEAMRRAFAARNARLGDPDFARIPVDDLLGAEWANAQRATIDPGRATPTAELFPRAVPQKDGGPHTTHLAAVDPDGNAVALTTTVNNWFGSGVTVPGLGFVLNDEMDDFATVPGSANMFGLVQGEANAIAPGKRMLSSMSPTIVLAPDGSIECVLGAAGGSRIITTVFEELSNIVDFGMDAADAVSAPRLHQQDFPDQLVVEPHGLPDDVRVALERMGHTIQEAARLTDAPAIGRVGGAWIGAPEPRRPGSLALGVTVEPR